MAHFHRKPIIVPTDFSPSSLQAVRVAKSIAESDADITLVFVSHDYDLIVPANVWGADSLPIPDRDRQTERLQEWVTDNNLGDVQLAVRMGDPGTEVCKVAKEMDCKLIVVPSHGYSGMKRVLLGSVAERIIRHCHCSVLVLRREAMAENGSILSISEHWFPRKKVIVPVDFSLSTEMAIETALEVTDDRTSIDVLSIVPSLDNSVLLGSQINSDDVRVANRQEHLERHLAEQGYSAMQAHVKCGDPGLVIVEHAADVKSDLIVMPSHGRHGLQRMVLGSVTERVIRHSESPVLVLRRHDAE